MVNILYLCPDYRFEDKGNIFVDLIDTFVTHGHKVTVMTPIERRYKIKTHIYEDNNLKILYFKSLNFRGKVSVVEKGIATLLQGFLYKRSWKKHLSNDRYDIVIYATLPITYSPALKFFKKKMNCFTYLQQKDFFPQSAVDLGLINKESFLYKLFRRIEINLFKNSDKIGVLSDKNKEYLLNNNPCIEEKKVEVCPNGKTPLSDEKIKELKSHSDSIRNKYNIPKDKIMFLYGGNISRAQGVDYIKKTIDKINQEDIHDGFFLFVGRGNEFLDLRNHIQRTNAENIRIIEYVPKPDYDLILASADVGMVFLDNRFSIANIPSRTLSHADFGQPIIAATDLFTDYGEILERYRFGLWCESKNPIDMVNNIKKIIYDKEIREEFGHNSRKYLLEQATAEKAYYIIMNSYFNAINK